MKIWEILTWRLKKCENLANFGKETKKRNENTANCGRETKKYENQGNFGKETEKV